MTIMELLHTILWRQYKKSGVLEKGQLGRILLTVEDLETRLFRSACVIKMRFGKGLFYFTGLFITLIGKGI